MEKITFINSKGQSVELGNDSPFILTKIEGTGAVNVDIQTQKSPFQDGEIYIDNRLEPRSLSIEIMVLAEDKKEMMKNRRKLLQVFNPKLGPGKLIYEFGNNRKEIEAISELAPVFPDAGDFKDTMQPSLIQLLAPEPFFKDIEGIETDLVTWIPNLEFDVVEGFSTEQLENHWIETQIKKQGLQVFKKGTIYLELEEESTVPEVEIAYLLENGQYKRLKQQATVFSTGTGYDENGNYVDVSDSIVNGQINEISIFGNTEVEEDNVKSTFGAIRLKSVEKNLFDGEVEKGSLSTTSGKPIYSSTYMRSKNFIRVKPSTRYSFKHYNSNRGFAYFLYDINKNFIASLLWGSATQWNVTTTEDTAFMKMVFISPTEEIKVVITEGDLPASYEPYTESTLYVTAKDEEGNILELRSLPNGVKDEIDVANRKLIKRIGEKANVSSGTVINYTDMAEGGTYYAWNDNGETETGTKGDTLGIDAITLIYQLAEPIVKLLLPEPLTTFEEFESGIGVGEPIEFGYRLTKQIVEIENIGDVDAPIRVVFRAHGQVEKPYIQDVETREMIRINKTLESGDVLEITTEFGNKNVFLNGEKAHHYLDFLNSTWIQLKPGVNLIKYGAESGVELLECRLFYTPRYLGV